MPAPASCCFRLGKHSRILQLIGSLGFTKQLLGICLDDEVGLVVIVSIVSNLEHALARFEPFHDLTVFFKETGEATLRIAVELLRGIKAFIKSREKHSTDILLSSKGIL